MSEKSKPTLAAIFHDIESLMAKEPDVTTESTGLTLWISVEYKAKYDELQMRTNRKFVEKLKELVCLAIDAAIEK